MRNSEWVRERLQWEDWETLLAETVRFAKWQIGRWYWRGEKGEGVVLPDGYDANSIVAEVVAGVLAGKVRLAIGWTRERLVRELERRVTNEIRRLYALKEAASMRNERAVLPLTEDGKRRSVFREMPGALADGCETAMENEEGDRVESVIARVRGCLDGDEVAKGLLDCLAKGVVKRREIAERLGIDVRAVTAARKRLERKVKFLNFEF